MLWRTALVFAFIPAVVSAAPKSSEYAGSKSCITCHAREFASWRKTPMANASGPAAEAIILGSFNHAPTTAHFAIRKTTAGPVIDYRKQLPSNEQVAGSIALEYFVGSGKRGRTYLFQREGWWFEAPINWYTKKHLWDMPPGLQSASEIPLTLPVDTGCLQCHATNVMRAAADSRNMFGAEPFAEGGIGCEACHGPAGEHVRRGGKRPMVQIARLAPAARDSICMQCHLEAEIQVDRTGRKKSEYRPGEDLLQTTDFFFHPEDKKLRAVSQFESLWESRCKAASGTKMTCTTCHEPHATVPTEERVEYYRSRCLACHGESFGRKHKSGDPNCIGCHMPTREADVAHEEATDHRILRTPAAFKIPAQDELFHFPEGTRAAHREEGLAYAQAAAKSGGDPQYLERAREELESATRAGKRDAQTAAALGFVRSRTGNMKDALEAYEAALERGSTDPAVLNDAAVLYADSGKTRTALALWERAFEANPWQSELGMNLAQLYCGVGKTEAAATVLNRVLAFNPDHARARALLAQQCGHKKKR